MHFVERATHTSLNLRTTIGDGYDRARIVQFLAAYGNSEWIELLPEDAPLASAVQAATQQSINYGNDVVERVRMSPIVDESSVDLLEDSNGDVECAGLVTANSWLNHSTESYFVPNDLASVDCDEVFPHRTPPDVEHDLSVRSSFLVSAAPAAEAESVEICFAHFLGPIFDGLERPVRDDEIVCLRIFPNDCVKKTVIERDTDDLTKEEIITHQDKVTDAIATELKTWNH